MRVAHRWIMAVGLALTAGCGTAQTPSSGPFDETYEQVSQARERAEAASASSLALAALAVQTALFHLTSACADTAARTQNRPGIMLLTSLVFPGAQTTYDLDPNAGTGSVKASRDGRESVNLSFEITPESLTGEVRYRLRNVKGTVEGYQLSLPSMLFRFTAPAGSLSSYRVQVETDGSLGRNDQVSDRIERTTIDFAFPREGPETRIGTISLLHLADRRSLQGATFLTAAAAEFRSTISDAAGRATYAVTVRPDGSIDASRLVP